MKLRTGFCPLLIVALICLVCAGAGAQNVTFMPYIQPGDAGPMGASDQMVVAWQTDETTPNPSEYTVVYSTGVQAPQAATVVGRVVDNYLAADSQFASLTFPSTYGAHVDYYAVLGNLAYATTYTYTVTGPGLPSGSFTAPFITRQTGSIYSFEVQGDEGAYPTDDSGDTLDYEARIIHAMYDVANYTIAGAPALPQPNFAVNTGDNVYSRGDDSEYQNHWFPNWNSNTDDCDNGAPFIRSIPLYIVDGNHDVGGQGDIANLISSTSGGDALDHFNNFYFPLNGPTGADIQNIFNGNTSSPTGMVFQDGPTFTSPTAIATFRSSTTVNTGQGTKEQIDHQSNYSFDYGNAHFVFLDANPHVFDDILDESSSWANAPTFPFPAYPSVLQNWLINDLDSSRADWKIVIFHQPSFSSGSATLHNDQMRRVAKFLEDHGANMVFNGHEHNYQRTLPLRALPGVTSNPTEPGPAAVAIDAAFDGVTDTVPDGVIYFVEGAGGNREFDTYEDGGRGSSGFDQDDSASGPDPTLGFDRGPASWLDTNLTDDTMTEFVPGAGLGPKITVHFKSRVFSFADVMVNGDTLSLYQLSEPLSSTSEATPVYGTDYFGNPINAPLPDTIVDPNTGAVISGTGGDGVPALLDTVTITRPNISSGLTGSLSGPSTVTAGGTITYTVNVTNNAGIGLNGTQVVFQLPNGLTLAAGNTNTTQNGQYAVVTIGRLGIGASAGVNLVVDVPANASLGTQYITNALVRTSTAQPVSLGSVTTTTVPLAPPTNLQATAGNAQVSLSWTASSGAATYKVYRGTTSGGETLYHSGVMGTTYVDTGVVNGTTYYYEVTAVNLGGETGPSNEVFATPNVPIPPAPTHLVATPGNAQVGLTWTGSSGATSYNVYEGTTSGGETLLQSTGGTGTTFVVTGLTNGTTYYFKVTAMNGAGESSFSNEVSATPNLPPPPTPTALTATAGNAQVLLSWTASLGATGYNLYRATSSGAETIYQSNLTLRSYLDTSVTNGTTYYYEVTAVNSAAESGKSNEASATPQVVAPPPPTHLVATAGVLQVGLSWTASAGAASYNVYRSTFAGTEALYQSGVTGTSYTDLGVTGGLTYYYKVAAVNVGGVSGYSNEVSVMPKLPAAPPAPIGLMATAGNAQVSLTWTASAGAVSYNVYRAKFTGEETLYQSGITGTSYTDLNAANGTTYYYKVKAVNPGGLSAYSNEASAKPHAPVPPAPTNLVAVGGAKQISLSWTASAGATAYRVYRSRVPGGEALLVGGITTTSHVDKSVTVGVTYYYKVVAVNATGASPPSNEASAFASI